MLTTLMLAAGLFAAPEPQVPPQGQGWVVEIRGEHFYQREKPQEWIIELNGFTRHQNGIELQIEPVEVQYYDDLSEFFKQFGMPPQIEPIEGFYTDDLPAFFRKKLP